MSKVSHRELQNAVCVVNTTLRGPYDPPLVVVVKCDGCRSFYAVLAQHVHNTHVCKGCTAERRRESRRKK
jgi:hypothetical protein